MQLKNIKAINFKNFKELDVSFNSLNLLIGSNASGKSNFIQLFKFIKDLSSLGIENALSLQGDVDFFKNLSIFNQNTIISYTFKNDTINQEFSEIIYEIEFSYNDKIHFKKEILKLISNGSELVLINKNGSLEIIGTQPEGFPIRIIEKKISNRNCLAQIIFDLFDLEIFSNKIYDFDIQKAKLPSTINDIIELKENGENLAVSIRHIFKNNENKEAFINLVQQALPFIKDINIENYFNENLVLNLKESYYKDTFLPSSVLSDGTIIVFCLIIALFFDNSKIKIFEEPERALHPYLISRIVSLFYDSSRENQIFLTSHNPEMLKCIKLDDIFVISRDNEGFSQIKNIREFENLEVFLSNDLGIDQIISSSLLE